MAYVRVQCPACNAELEIDEQHLGQEVECGSCLQTFVAQDASARPSSRGRRSERDDDRDEDRPRRRRSRRAADDDDYDYSPPRARSGGGNALGVVSLIFGILSYPLMCCCYLNIPTALVAIVCGAIGLSNPQSKGLSIAGLILGGLNLLVFGALFLFGLGINMVNMGR